MLISKGPESVKTVKVKGHVTEKMVQAGAVRSEDKIGNDQADEAAGRGSKMEQRRLHALTGLYAARHEAYRKFMGNVQKFLVHMQKAEKEAWKEKTSVTEPNFAPQKMTKTKKVKAVNFLAYAKDNNSAPQAASSSTYKPIQKSMKSRMCISEIRREDCKGPKQIDQRRQVRIV